MGKCFGFEAIQRSFAGLAVHASVGGFAQLLPRLPVHVVPIGEPPQRPEVLAQVTDGSFECPSFPSRLRDCTRAGRTAMARLS